MLQDGEAVDDKVSLLTINVLCRISKYAAYPTVINPAIIPKEKNLSELSTASLSKLVETEAMRATDKPSRLPFL